MSMAFYDTPERQAINLSEDNARLRSELAKAQAENARLAAQAKVFEETKLRLHAENFPLCTCLVTAPSYPTFREQRHLESCPLRKAVERVEWELATYVNLYDKAEADKTSLRGALGTAIELLDRYSAAVHCLSIDREPEVEEQVKRLREIYLSNPEQSILSAAVDKARGGPTPPKEYQGFA